MSRKFSIFLVLCIALFGAILAGYWDMLSSERRTQEAATVAEGVKRAAPAASPDAPADATAKAPAQTDTKTAETAPAAPANPAASTAPATTSAPEAETKAASNTPAASRSDVVSEQTAVAPRFDLLRVEPDGSAVIAGQAPADSEVRILSGDKEIGSAKASRDGDFALVLDERLTVGSHSIRIEARAPDGQTKASQEVAVVSVPNPGNPGDLLAMIEQPGQPSRIIAVPKPEVSTPAADAAKAKPPATAQEPASTAAPAALAPAPQPFAVEAVEIENGTIYIAGRAEGKNPVRVYVDEKLVGEDRNRANDRFLVTAAVPLSPGEHRIRADILGSDGKVASRVEVPFTKPESETMSAMASDEPQTEASPAPETAASAAPAETAPVPSSETPSKDSAAEPSTAPASTAASDIGTVVQPALKTVDTRVLIRRGDTLWRISRDTYGLGRRYTVIYLANGDQIRNPNRIYPGQLLRLPKHEDDRQAN